MEQLDFFRRMTVMLQQAAELSKTDKYEEALTVLDSLQLQLRLPEHSSLIAQCLNIRGIIAKNKSQFSNALEYYQNALRIFKRLDDLHRYALVLGNIGVVYKSLSDFQQALHFYQESLDIYKKIENTTSVAIVLGNIGILYRNLEKYEIALEYLLKALHYHQENNDMFAIEREYGNIGNVYKDLGQYDIAKQYHLMALVLSEKIGRPSGLMVHYAGLADIEIELGNYNQALELLEKAIRIAQDLGKQRDEAAWLHIKGHILSRLDFVHHNVQEAIPILIYALSISNSLADKVTEFKCHHTLAELYKHQEEWRLCAYHFEQFFTLQKEVQSKEAKELAERMAFRTELGKKKVESELLQKKNAELHELNEFKTRLLGIAAHDLKNPLSSIIGASRVVESEVQDNASLLEWVEIIITSATHMQHLIGSLLESTSASLGKMTLHLGEIDIVELIQHSIEMHKKALESKSQYIAFHTPTHCIMYADERKLYQIADNLISNAIKYSYPQTVIDITLRDNDNETITFMVKDEGQGLDEHDLSKVFGQFQRLSSQPTAGESSTGLGLHIVKHIVELHGGTITVESEGKNKGCLFTVVLPKRTETLTLTSEELE